MSASTSARHVCPSQTRPLVRSLCLFTRGSRAPDPHIAVLRTTLGMIPAAFLLIRSTSRPSHFLGEALPPLFCADGALKTRAWKANPLGASMSSWRAVRHSVRKLRSSGGGIELYAAQARQSRGLWQGKRTCRVPARRHGCLCPVVGSDCHFSS